MFLASCEKDTSFTSLQDDAPLEISGTTSLENRNADCGCTIIWSDPDGLGPNNGTSGWHIELYAYNGQQYDPILNPVGKGGLVYNSMSDQVSNPNFGFEPFSFPAESSLCWVASITAPADPNVQVVLDCGGNEVCWNITNSTICGETSYKECLDLDADCNLIYNNATGSPDDPFDPCTDPGFNGYGPCS
ncbi:MAG: hypothetical protein AB8F78_18630 [Saprospiraceae bacterium]